MVALLFACLACAGLVHGIQQAHASSRHSMQRAASVAPFEKPNTSKSFAGLLLALGNPTSGWQVTANGHNFAVGLSSDKHSTHCSGGPTVSEHWSTPSKHMQRDMQPVLAHSLHRRVSLPSMVVDWALPAQMLHTSKVANLQLIRALSVMVHSFNLNSVAWQFALAFVSGGLFFSTVLAAAGKFCRFVDYHCYRFSQSFMLGVRRLWVLVLSTIRVVDACPSPPLENDSISSRSTSIWSTSAATLRERFAFARQAAAKGVKAIKAAAEGVKADKLQAETIERSDLVIAQYMLRQFTPHWIAGMMSDELTKILAEVTHPTLSSLKLKQLDLGESEPQLLAARLYELGKDDMAIDFDVRWRSSLVAQIDAMTKVGAKIPVSVHNLHFQGPIRVLITKLSTKSPFYGALLISLPNAPVLGFDVRVAGGELTRLPWLRAELEKSLQLSLAEELIWPRRLVIPATPPPCNEPAPVLTPAELAALAHDDPLLCAERALATQFVPKEEPSAMKSKPAKQAKAAGRGSEEKKKTKPAKKVELEMPGKKVELKIPAKKVELEMLLKMIKNMKVAYKRADNHAATSRPANDMTVNITIGAVQRKALENHFSSFFKDFPTQIHTRRQRVGA